MSVVVGAGALPRPQGTRWPYLQMLDGEMYPPSVEEAPVLMHYPRGVPPRSQMAVGQEVFGLLPGLMLYATLWLREHNRVCDLLKAEHPTWGDEQLFQTARLILIGEGSKCAPSRKVVPSVLSGRGWRDWGQTAGMRILNLLTSYGTHSRPLRLCEPQFPNLDIGDNAAVRKGKALHTQ